MTTDGGEGHQSAHPGIALETGFVHRFGFVAELMPSWPEVWAEVPLLFQDQKDRNDETQRGTTMNRHFGNK